jgi:hypothetical protein
VAPATAQERKGSVLAHTQLTAGLALSLVVCVDSGCRRFEQSQSQDLNDYKGLPLHQLFGPIPLTQSQT